MISRLTLNLRNYLDLTKTLDIDSLAAEVSWWGPHFRNSSVNERNTELDELEQAPIELVVLNSRDEEADMDSRRLWMTDR